MSERIATEIAEIKSAAVRRRVESIRNRAFRGAYLKGRRARREGEPASANPYAGSDGLARLSTFGWQSVFSRHWREGWQEGGAP